MTKTVLISGASGFIGGHCVIEMLNHGYAVRGAIRDLNRGDKLRAAFSKHTSNTAALEFVQADLLDADSWLKASQSCDGILHVASPVPIIQPKNPDDIVIPAREGALNVLRAAKSNGVKRLVLTSSIAAVLSSHRTNGTYNDSDWTNLQDSTISAYTRSKTEAEKAAWEFVKENDEIGFSAINPVMVLGPALESDYGSSLELLVKIMRRELPMLPHIGFGCVDVRDVASLHRLAFEDNNAIGKRYLCSNGFRWLRDIADTLRNDFPAFDKKIPHRDMPDFLVKLTALFVKELKPFVADLNKRKDIDTSLAQALGWKPRSPEQAIQAGGQSLIDLNIVKP